MGYEFQGLLPRLLHTGPVTVTVDVYYIQWCEQDSRCHRLLLTDLLIAPMQLCTKVPLLLNNILQHTIDPLEKLHLSACLEALEKSLSQ